MNILQASPFCSPIGYLFLAPKRFALSTFCTANLRKYLHFQSSNTRNPFIKSFFSSSRRGHPSILIFWLCWIILEYTFCSRSGNPVEITHFQKLRPFYGAFYHFTDFGKGFPVINLYPRLMGSFSRDSHWIIVIYVQGNSKLISRSKELSKTTFFWVHTYIIQGALFKTRLSSKHYTHLMWNTLEFMIETFLIICFLIFWFLSIRITKLDSSEYPTTLKGNILTRYS